jgi:hypothetical protein
LGAQEQQGEDTKKVIDLWGNMMEETLKAQAEWMNAWAAANKAPVERPEGAEGDQTLEDEAQG